MTYIPYSVSAPKRLAAMVGTQMRSFSTPWPGTITQEKVSGEDRACSPVGKVASKWQWHSAFYFPKLSCVKAHSCQGTSPVRLFEE